MIGEDEAFVNWRDCLRCTQEDCPVWRLMQPYRINPVSVDDRFEVWLSGWKK